MWGAIMSLDYDTIKSMSNQALFSMLANKKQTIEHLQKKGEDSKKLEMDFCYLMREKQLRFRRKDDSQSYSN